MSDQTSEQNLTAEPSLELDPEVAHEKVNGHTVAPIKSQSKRAAAQRPGHVRAAADGTEPATSPSIFDRIADNIRELDAKELALRDELGAILVSKNNLLEMLGGKEAVDARRPADFEERYATPDHASPNRAMKPARKRVRTAKPAHTPVLSTLERTAPKTRKRAGKRVRRSKADIVAAAKDGVASVVALLKKHKEGLRAEQIRGELKMEKKAWLEVVKAALDSKSVKKKGQKRSTVYTAAK